MKITEILTEDVKQRLDPKCWKGKHKEGTKIKGGVRVNNCVPNESVEEGYKVVPDIDRERYQERQGLEGPFRTKSGKVVYYDKVEGKYYDPDTDMYIEHDDWMALNEEDIDEGETWSKHNNPRAGGMSKKSVKSYRRSHPGSKIQTAVTTKPSKLKKGSKDAKRRKSFCARMKGMKKSRTSAKTARDPNSNINKSLRRWHCESVEEMRELVTLAEQFIRKHKQL